jgi:hypothetical protein
VLISNAARPAVKRFMAGLPFRMERGDEALPSARQPANAGLADSFPF